MNLFSLFNKIYILQTNKLIEKSFFVSISEPFIVNVDFRDQSDEFFYQFRGR